MICRISLALVGVWNKCKPHDRLLLLLGEEGSPNSRVDPVDPVDLNDPVRMPATFKSTYLKSNHGQLVSLYIITSRSVCAILVAKYHSAIKLIGLSIFTRGNMESEYDSTHSNA